jgi:prepilin-type N-terminal cleavage/methylation domain-containing protein
MSRRTSEKRSGLTLIELLVVIAIIAVLFALLIPAIQKVRAAAAVTECSSKLKQLGLALNGYHDINGHFPIQACPQIANTLGYSWMYKILPYIEQDALFKLGSNRAWASNDDQLLVQKDASGKVTAPPIRLDQLERRLGNRGASLCMPFGTSHGYGISRLRYAFGRTDELPWSVWAEFLGRYGRDLRQLKLVRGRS